MHGLYSETQVGTRVLVFMWGHVCGAMYECTICGYIGYMCVRHL